MRGSCCIGASLLLPLLISSTSAQQPHIPAPHKPITPKIVGPTASPRPAVLRSLVGGFWMAGPDRRSSIHLSSDVITSSIPVTPVLYLSSGRRLQLPRVNLAPSGVAILSINEALAQANVPSNKETYGYVAVQYWMDSTIILRPGVRHRCQSSHAATRSRISSGNGAHQAKLRVRSEPSERMWSRTIPFPWTAIRPR